jgi:hypothetical protein
MIRHGEKPLNDGIGLSKAGTWRSEKLPGVFGTSKYDIKYILAEKPKARTLFRAHIRNRESDFSADDGHDERPYLTVLPLANSLGLKPENGGLDIRFKRGDSSDVADAVNNFQGTGNILICWEHHALTNLATAIGVTNAPEYNGDR